MNNVKPSRTVLYLILFLLIAGTSFAYWNIDKCEFVNFDDYQYVSNNYHITSGFNKKNILWAFSSFYAANWHPLTWLSHTLDCQLYGLKPAGHHLTNLVFHLLNVLLLFFVLKGMTGAVWRSALVAALFGLHPLHVESVAWVSERKDVLSTFFMFLALLCYSSFSKFKKWGYYFGALFVFALGLMAKPMLVTLPFVLLLIDFWPLRRLSVHTEPAPMPGNNIRKKNLPDLLTEKIPFFILAAASCIITVLAQSAGNAIGKTDKISLLSGLANSVISYVSYIGKMFLPVNLSFYYPFPAALPSVWNLLFCCIILIIITGIALFLVKKMPYLLMGWFWFLGTMVPVIGIVPIGSQAMADRYTYIPLIGLFIIIAWLLHNFASRSRIIKIIVITFSLTVLCLITFQTRKQVQYWKNDLALGNHGLAVSKANFFAYNIKGNYLLSHNSYNEAFRCFSTSLSLCPNQPTTRSNIGLIYLKQGKPKEAVTVYKEILSKDPNDIIANLNCGNALGMLGDTKSAIQCFNRVIAVDSSVTPAIHNLGEAYGALKEYQKCKQFLLEAIRRNPNDAESCYALGNCCFYDNDMVEAVRWYEKSISIWYNFADSHRQLGKAYASCGRQDLEQKQFSIADSLASLLAGNRK
jgi:Flp pilus assembly protein TadD